MPDGCICGCCVHYMQDLYGYYLCQRDGFPTEFDGYCCLFRSVYESQAQIPKMIL